MQRDRRKRHPPARHPVLLRRVLLVLCILAVLWLGYSCMMPQLLFSARRSGGKRKTHSFSTAPSPRRTSPYLKKNAK